MADGPSSPSATQHLGMLDGYFRSSEISTADILGASSAGWSPSKSSRSRGTFSPLSDGGSLGLSSTAMNGSSSSQGSPTKSPSKQFDPNSLGRHALVSNSVFKAKSGSEPTSAASVQTAPLSPVRGGMGRGGGRAPPQMGVGLGIAVDSPARVRNDTRGEQSHPSAQAPRQSQGYALLKQSSYVSSSPFKSGPLSPEAEEFPSVRPLSFSSPSRQRTGTAMEPPRTPTRASAASSGSSATTPRGPTAASPRAGVTSPRSLLTSNRLHGPRQMSKSFDSPARTSQQDRQKTVTFDEEPRIQEFDRESSFDGSSLRSAGSVQSLTNVKDSVFDLDQVEDDDMFWTNGLHRGGELMVINGSSLESSEASSPELSDNNSSPQLLDNSSISSLDSKEGLSQSETDEPTLMMAPLQPMQGVESMVDELLGTELLSPQGTGVIQETTQEPLSALSPFRASSANQPAEDSFEEPVRRGTSSPTKPRPLLPATPVTEADRSTSFLTSPAAGTPSALPTLPNWSPLMFSEESMPGFQQAPPSPTRPAAQTRPPVGRPHISRDAVLARVAREKKAQAEAEAAEQQKQSTSTTTATDASLPASHTISEIVPPASTSAVDLPKIRPAQSMDLSSSTPQRPKLHTGLSSFEAKKEPLPTPVPALGGSVSPLDRLGEQMAKQVEQQSGEDSTPTVALPKEKMDWFDSNETSRISIKPEEVKEPAKRESGELLQALVVEPQQKDAGKLNVTQASRALQPRQGPVARKPRRTMSVSDAVSPLLSSSRSKASSLSSEAEDAGQQQLDELPDIPQDRAQIQAELKDSKLQLDGTVQKALDVGFGNGLCRDISRIFRDGETPYKINDRGAFAGVDDKVSHSTKAGDVDTGRAWRKIRRASDINEYAEEMKAYRANENPKKASGKVFVLVDSFRPAGLPVPSTTTKFYCILDNGLHVVKTGSSTLRPGQGVPSPISQEFELIQHKNLEFSLTLFVEKAAHLQQPIASSAASTHGSSGPSTPSKREKAGSVTKSFMSKLLRSPKKEKSGSSSSLASQGPPPLLSYMNREGALGRVDCVFEKIAPKCLGRCLTVDLPVRGLGESPSTISGQQNSISSVRSADFQNNLSKSRGMLRLKVFYLPPMPNVPKKMMPENLRECITGMEAARWQLADAKLSGTLTQQGGDCSTWRRRPMKAQGCHLICFNEVTKKAVVKIDLSKATKIEEAWDPYDTSLITSRDGKKTARATMVAKYNINEEPDESYHVARSFRLTFADSEKIAFFADSDEEKDKWIEVMAEMVNSSERPSAPIWAQCAWTIIKDVEAGNSVSGNSKTAAATSPSSPSKPTAGASGPQSVNSAGPQTPPKPAGILNKSTSGSSTNGSLITSKMGPSKLSVAFPPTVQEESSSPAIARPSVDQQPSTSNNGRQSPIKKPAPAGPPPTAFASRSLASTTPTTSASSPQVGGSRLPLTPGMIVRPQSTTAMFTPARKGSVLAAGTRSSAPPSQQQK